MTRASRICKKLLIPSSRHSTSLSRCASGERAIEIQYFKSLLERHRKLSGVKAEVGAESDEAGGEGVASRAKASAKQKKLALPVTPSSCRGVLHQGECKERD